MKGVPKRARLNLSPWLDQLPQGHSRLPAVRDEAIVQFISRASSPIYEVHSMTCHGEVIEGCHTSVSAARTRWRWGGQWVLP